MLNIKQKIGAAMATAAAAFSAMSMAAYADTSVTGNGAFSENTVNVSSSNSTNLTQSNESRVVNNIQNTANTGGVVASFNTGGDVQVRTGDATAVTNVNVQGGSNVANVEGCCSGGSNVKVSGNGAFSENDVNEDTDNSLNVRQVTRQDVMNAIINSANTGGIVGSFNTGGDVDVETGDATATTNVQVGGSRNVLNVEGGNTGGGSNIQMSGNGAFSENDVNVDTDSDVNVTQVNDSNVVNNINNSANTGNVSAVGNTGGDVHIETGDATARTDVRVDGNTNFLNLEGCATCSSFGTDIWISGNGAFSENTVRVNSDNDVDVRQDNYQDVHNNLHNAANTGVVGTSGFGGGWFDRNNHDYDYDHNYKDFYKKMKEYYDRMYKKYDDYDRNHHGYKKHNDYGYQHYGKYKDKHGDDYDFSKERYNKDTHHDSDKYHHKKFKYADHKPRYDNDYDNKFSYHKPFMKHNSYYDKDCECEKDKDHYYDHGKKYDKYDYKPVRFVKKYDHDYDKYYKKYHHDKDHAYKGGYFMSYKPHMRKDYDRDHDKKFAYTCGDNNHYRPQYQQAKFYPKHRYNKHGNYSKNNSFDKFGRLPFNHYNNYFHGFGYGGHTGGNVTIRTGDATAHTNVHVSGNTNRLFM